MNEEKVKRSRVHSGGLGTSSSAEKRQRNDRSKSDTYLDPEVIVLLSEEDEKSEMFGCNKSLVSPLRLLYNPSYGSSGSVNELFINKGAVVFSELVGVADLMETFQFNFSIDVNLFTSCLHPNMLKNHRKITFVTGSELLNVNSEESLDTLRSRFEIHEVIADMPFRFGSHHSKFMVNFFEDLTCEIVIMSCNLQEVDLLALTQMCWRSGRLVKDSGAPKEDNDFKRDFINYLRRYKKTSISELATVLREYSFLNIDVELVASAPGRYNLSRASDKSEIYGYGKLRQVLQRNGLLVDNDGRERKFRFLAQVSSIAYPYTLHQKRTSSIFSHLLCPLIFSGKEPAKMLEPGKESSEEHQDRFNYVPYIVFPSTQDITESNSGVYAGQAIHFKFDSTATHRNHYNQCIKPYLCKWNSSISADETGREKVPPHVKLYICDNGDEWETFRFVLMGSHNLSKQAWGGPDTLKFVGTDPSKYTISSYELSVLVPGKSENSDPSVKELKSVYRDDQFSMHANTNARPIRMPFKVPPKRYAPDDEPWSISKYMGTLLSNLA